MIGTGFVISNEGHVITSAHVIQGGSIVEFCTPKQSKFEISCNREGTLELIAKDTDLDLALLQLPKGSRLSSYLVFADSGQTEIGDSLNIIGYPGSGAHTVNLSQGVVSGFIGEYIKTDARIFPGNSGGPALNENNQVVGLASALTTDDYKNLGILTPSKMIREWLKTVGFGVQSIQKSKVKTDVSQKSCFDKATFAKNYKYCSYLLHKKSK